MKILNDEQQLNWMLRGLGIYGVGGGGDPMDFGAPVIAADLDQNRSYQLVDLADVPDDATIVTGGYLGSVADPIDVHEVLARWEENFEFGQALRKMERYLGKSIDYLLASELGGGNTIVMLTAGARLGLPVVDGDGAGRAVPETQMTSLVGHDLPLTPMNLLDLDGNLVLVEEQTGLFADQIGRFMVTRTHGMVASVNSPITGRDAKRAIVPGTISEAIELGRFCSTLSGFAEERLDRLSTFLKGVSLFWGEVDGVKGDNTKGHYYAQVYLRGAGRYEGERFRIAIKNETMAGWRNDKPICVFPDLLMMVNPNTLEGIMSASITKGTEMLLIGKPCSTMLIESMQRQIGAVAFSSERYGERLSYCPVTELTQGSV